MTNTKIETGKMVKQSKELHFEPVPSDRFDVYRAKVPGGWLVATSNDAVVTIHDIVQEGYQWRTSITFMPDPKHEWEVE